MIVNLCMAFDDRAHAAASPADDDAPRSRAYRALGDPAVRDRYREDNPAGPRRYKWWSMFFEAETDQEVRDIRNDLNAEYPGQLRTMGAWWFDSRQVGTEFVLDADGQITGVTGIPIFPLHARILEFVPDVVTWDDAGNVVSSARPTELADVNLLQGQTERRFD